MEKIKGMYEYNEKLKLVLDGIKSEKQDKIVMKQFFRENYEALTKIKTAAYLKDLKGNDKIREFCLVEGIISSYEELKDSKIDNYLSEIKKERHGRTRKKSKPVINETEKSIEEQKNETIITMDENCRNTARLILKDLYNKGKLNKVDWGSKDIIERRAVKAGFTPENYKDTDCYLLFLLKEIEKVVINNGI